MLLSIIIFQIPFINLVFYQLWAKVNTWLCTVQCRCVQQRWKSILWEKKVSTKKNVLSKTGGRIYNKQHETCIHIFCLKGQTTKTLPIHASDDTVMLSKHCVRQHQRHNPYWILKHTENHKTNTALSFLNPNQFQ